MRTEREAVRLEYAVTRPMDLAVIQVAVNTTDMSGTLRLYSDIFGFTNAGANAIWGSVMRLQQTAQSERALMWWLVGRQKRVQIEVFQQTQQRLQGATHLRDHLRGARVGAATSLLAAVAVG